MEPIRVILFDDHKDTREALSMLVKGTHGLQLSGAFEDCTGMLENIKQLTPNLVLMDLNMPHINGIEAIEILKNAFPDLLILVLTVFEDEDKIFASLNAGASGYVLKSMPPAKLVDAIFEILDGGSPMSPSIARKVLTHFHLKIPVKTKQSPPEGIDLSNREKDVLLLLTKGWSYKMIADELSINYETVRSHMKSVYKKLHVGSMTEAVIKALQEKIV